MISPAHLLTLPVTLVTRTADPDDPDEYGNPADVLEAFPTTCELQQIGTREEGGDAVQVSTWRVFLPADAPARGWDALQLEDDAEPLYELTGDPWLVRNPLSGEISHLEAMAVRVE